MATKKKAKAEPEHEMPETIMPPPYEELPVAPAEMPEPEGDDGDE